LEGRGARFAVAGVAGARVELARVGYTAAIVLRDIDPFCFRSWLWFRGFVLRRRLKDYVEIISVERRSDVIRFDAAGIAYGYGFGRGEVVTTTPHEKK
jgi:hypothetical protein